MSMKFKKLLLQIFSGALLTTAMLSPSLSQALEETGAIAATKAADQKAALAKKAKAIAERKASEAAAVAKTSEAKEPEVENKIDKTIEHK